MDPELYEPAPRSAWPTVIGVICIVLASLGLLCYGCNSASTILQPMVIAAMPADQRPPTPQGAQLVYQVIALCASFLLSIWLLIAGIGLCRRRSWSRAWCLGWAWLKILLSVVSTAVGFLFAGALAQQVNDQLARQPGGAPFTLTKEIFIVFFIITLVWNLIWPVFIIGWFSRARVKEEVAAWAEETAMMI